MIPLQKILGFLKESLIRRKLNVDRRHSVLTIKNQLESTVAAGFSSFAKNLTASLTEEGIKLTLDQFVKGFGYKVEKVSDVNEMESCLKMSDLKRGPSAARFRCLISRNNTDNDGFMIGEYYKVTSRVMNGSVDLVFINPSGNIACTSPSYARWGIPSKHILAVFIDGGICLNMKQHFHPVYHLQFMNDIAENMIAEFSATSDVTNGAINWTDSTTTWNWAQKTSHQSWEAIGLGGHSYNSVAHPSVKSISQARESVAEKTKKAINFIVPYINNSKDEREIFYLYYEGLLKR